MQPSQTPKSMIEILKFTYDFDYAREQSMKAAKELYPELNQEGLIPIAQMLGNGMQLNEQMAQDFEHWELDDIEAFVRLYDEECSSKGNNITHYVMVDELLKAAAAQIYNRSEPEQTPQVPQWFVRHYIGQLEQIREKVQSISLDLN